MRLKVPPQGTSAAVNCSRMNVSLAFVQQGIGRARGGFFGPSEKGRCRTEISLAEFAQPKRQIAGCLRRAGKAQTQATRNEINTRILARQRFPASPTSAGIRLVHRFAESDSHEHLSIFAQHRSANAPESPAPLCSFRAQSAHACRSPKGSYSSS